MYPFDSDSTIVRDRWYVAAFAHLGRRELLVRSDGPAAKGRRKVQALLDAEA